MDTARTTDGGAQPPGLTATQLNSVRCDYLELGRFSEGSFDLVGGGGRGVVGRIIFVHIFYPGGYSLAVFFVFPYILFKAFWRSN